MNKYEENIKHNLITSSGLNCFVDMSWFVSVLVGSETIFRGRPDFRFISIELTSKSDGLTKLERPNALDE